MFPATSHEEFMELPVEYVRWMMAIHGEVQAVENKRR